MTGLEKVSRPRAVTGIAVALMLVGLVSICPSASAAPRGCQGRIAFDSVRLGNRDIYAIPPLATDATTAPTATPLTASPASDAKPSWSPPSDSCPATPPPSQPRLLAFQRTSGGTTDIWILDAAFPESDVGAPAESRPKLVISRGAAPAWAPQGVPGIGASSLYPPIAFEREGDNGKRDIFVANYDGSDQSNLTNTPDADEANPEWSSTWLSDTAHLAFDSDRGGRRELWVMDLRYDPSLPGGYEPLMRQVTAGAGGSSFAPSWFAFTDPETFQSSNLYDLIAFAGPDEDGANSQIHYVESDHVALPFSRPETIFTSTLTSGSGEHTAPAWSPHCQDLGPLPSPCRIAYQGTGPGGDSEIFVMDPFLDEETDAKDLNVTDFPGGDDKNPDWEASSRILVDVFRLRHPRGRRSRPRSRIARVVVEPEPELPGGGSGVGGSGGSGDKCTKTGTAGNDVLCGTPKRDVLRGKDGDDRIIGRSGNDRLVGGAGDDRIVGGPGRDKIRGEAGDDRLDGGPGRDHISGGSGGDKIKARDRQRDRISGGRGSDAATFDRRDDVSGVEG